MSSNRHALLIATNVHDDPTIAQLSAPENDVENLAEVLRDPAVGGFEVTTLVNLPSYEVGDKVASFLQARSVRDLTLLYFSGHGIKDDRGDLHFAFKNTIQERVAFSSVSAEQINRALDDCRSTQKVVILDCCYSGAFPIGVTAKADDKVGTLSRLSGRGRVILTASDVTQFSFEGKTLVDGVERASSLFTRYLIEGIQSGDADLNGDGDISLDELYGYVHDKVVTERPSQRPKKQENLEGRIVFAWNHRWSLPPWIDALLAGEIPAARLQAIEAMKELHGRGNESVKTHISARLASIAENDDSVTVRSAATIAMAKNRTPPLPTPDRKMQPRTQEVPVEREKPPRDHGDVSDPTTRGVGTTLGTNERNQSKTDTPTSARPSRRASGAISSPRAGGVQKPVTAASSDNKLIPSGSRISKLESYQKEVLVAVGFLAGAIILVVVLSITVDSDSGTSAGSTPQGFMSSMLPTAFPGSVTSACSNAPLSVDDAAAASCKNSDGSTTTYHQLVGGRATSTVSVDPTQRELSTTTNRCGSINTGIVYGGGLAGNNYIPVNLTLFTGKFYAQVKGLPGQSQSELPQPAGNSTLLCAP
ncbi:caspase family protein [Actinomycetospora termitidis]|uniref:Caspase family protein n=1 Tax=Actinomycetospora termitidis TaxID=3053470 RepID=A0ABT7M1X0_9PSEU|nr:caspase family protein [Actinomycetospora sp. Odt1-22]MDL5154655.1 caspase family protein [Actinomycetospora sp. Odt1-22]